MLILLMTAAYADTESEQQLKVAFIFNFAKFVTWPTPNSALPLVICVAGSKPLLAKITLLQNKKIDTKPIEIRILTEDKQTQGCNMLFMSEVENRYSEKFLTSIATQPILTISDKPDFVREGGMIGLKESDNRLRFEINLLAAKKVGLSISSQLLQLADEVVQ